MNKINVLTGYLLQLPCFFIIQEYGYSKGFGFFGSFFLALAVGTMTAVGLAMVEHFKEF